MKFTASKYKCSGSIVSLPCSIIKSNSNLVRNSFNDEKIESIALSVKNNGVIQPLTVRITDGDYELISGELRLRAAKKVGLSTVPCIIMTANECESVIYSLIENIQRNDLNFFEEADAFNTLVNKFGMSQEAVGCGIGKSQSVISNKIRLLKIKPEIRDIIIKNSLTERHARALLRINDDELQLKALDYIIKRELNVSETDAYIDSLVSPVQSKNKPRISKLKDIKIFLNTINHAIDTMRKAGINALSSEHETNEYYEYVVRIPKMTSSPVSSCETV